MSDFFHDIAEKKRFLPLFISMMILYAASYFQRTSIPGTLFNDFQAEYGFSAAQIASLGSSYVYIYAFFQLVMGMLVDKYCGLRVVTFAGILFVVGALGFPFVCGNLIAMCFFRFLCGMGSSALYLSLVKETDRLFGRKNYAVMSGIVYFTGYSGGLFGTMPYAILKQHFNWNSILILVGFISLGLYMVFLLSKRNIPAAPIAPKPISLRPLYFLIKNPYSWLVMFCGTVNFCCYFTIQTVFGMKFLQDFVGMSSAAASTTVFSLTLVCMFTLLGGGIFTRMIGNRRKPLLIFACSSCLASTILMLAAAYFRLPAFCFVTGYILFAFASGFSAIFSIANQEVNTADTITQSAGCINMFNYLSVAIFSQLIGLFLDQYITPDMLTEGKAVIYPASAYTTLFVLLLIPTTISVICSTFIPETRGHFLRRSAKV